MDSLGIKAFLAIVQTRNLTKAAEWLHLSQSTVSHRLKVLERNVGKALIQRSKGRQAIELTSFGLSFVSIAERWSVLNRELEALQETGPLVRLNVGVADSLNLYVLPPLYRELIRLFPNLSLRILTQHTLECYEGIERRELDLAFVNVEKVLPNILTDQFYVDEMVLVRLAAPGRVSGAMLSLHELDQRHELYFNWGPAYQLWRERWRDTDASFRLQLDAAALIFYTLWDERQWAIIPRSIALALASPDKFVVQQLVEPPPARLCYRIRHRRQSAVIEPFLVEIDRMIQHLYSGSTPLNTDKYRKGNLALDQE